MKPLPMILDGVRRRQSIGRFYFDHAVKGKVVPVLPLNEHHTMKAYWGGEVQRHPFFDLGTRRR
jgi:hypothetical protein